MTPTSPVVPNYPSTTPYQIPHASILSEYREVEPSNFGLREELRTEFRRIWCGWREELFGTELKYSWTNGKRKWPYMLTIDGSAISILGAWQLKRFCNKPTVLYWTHSAQINKKCERFVWGCIYKEWFRCYDQAPILDFEHFFANPVCIKSTGPSLISEILDTHRLFYNRTFLFLDKLRRSEIDQTFSRAWRDRFKLLPVSRAIIVVFDENFRDYTNDPQVYLDLEVQRQNVLMVRTGDETGLSEPISFERVRDLALPLARPDIEPSDNIDAIRVPLATAVQFIVDLQRREEVAFPELALSMAVDRSICPCPPGIDQRQARITNADDFVDRAMEAIDEKGIDNFYWAKTAMACVQEARRGEHHDDSWRCFFEDHWR